VTTVASAAPDARTARPEGQRLKGHVPGLDGLRGLAVLLVLAFHAGYVVNHSGRFVPGGFIGVDAFFVLSGFLITSLLLGEHARSGGISCSRFYLRRACRLLPALVDVLFVHGLYTLAIHEPKRPEAIGIATILAYVSNWAMAFGVNIPPALRHAWSLAVEEQFYLVWPSVMLVVLRFVRSRAAIIGLLVAGMATSAVVRALVFHSANGYPAAYLRTDARADTILAGALLAFLCHWGWVPRRGVRPLAWAGLAGLFAITLRWSVYQPALYDGVFTLVALGVAAMIAALLGGGWLPGRFFESPPMRAAGRVSYGMYLWQVPVFYGAEHFLSHHSNGMQAAVGIVVTLIVTVASWFVVEQPFLRLKQRWEARPVPAAVVAPAVALVPAD
jgi:peptidoglycan/LPS O-acetylase OafA/YrhL